MKTTDANIPAKPVIVGPVVVGKEFYQGYYADKGVDRNSLLRNPQVLFQTLAKDASFYSALRMIDPDPSTCRILDVGCGSGASLVNFLRIGFPPANLFGIDFQEDRIQEGKANLTGINFCHGDATRMEFPDGAFDIVMESAMFIHSVDDDLSRKIAGEMLRVTRPGGHILLSDWRYAKPGSNAYRALTQKRIAGLFDVGKKTVRRGVFSGELLPPVGRFLSAHLPSAYFAVRTVMPFLVGQKATVLRRLEAKDLHRLTVE